jgi:ATP-dependent Clp protease ATP-binding subunit ClpX
MKSKYGIDLDHLTNISPNIMGELIDIFFLSPLIQAEEVPTLLNKIRDDSHAKEVYQFFVQKTNFYHSKLEYSEITPKILYNRSLNKIQRWIELYHLNNTSQIESFIYFNKLEGIKAEYLIMSRGVWKINNPYFIKQYLDKYVKGQEEAKKAISFAFYLHLVRCGIVIPENAPEDYSIEDLKLPKPNMMLIGSTGSGKTYIIKTLCKHFNIPYIKIDCSSLTSSGYIGKGIDNYFLELYKKCGKNAEKFNQSIIFFDEIDKLSEKATGHNGSVGGIEMQQELLTILEDDEIVFTEHTSGAHGQYTLKINNITFVFSGAFTGIEQIVSKRTGHQSLGFKKRSTESIGYGDVKPEDIIEFGLMPELVSRINFIETLEPITKEILVQILKESEDSPIIAYQNYFQIHGDTLSIDDEVLELIAEYAIQKGGGVRSLVTILQELLKNHLFMGPNPTSEDFHIDRQYFEKMFAKSD